VAFFKDLGLTLVFDYETKKLKKIIVLIPRLLVKGTAIRVGSKRSEVLKYFKDSSKNSKIDELDYPFLAVVFYFKEDYRTVRGIEVKPKKRKS
jgi:hypothetical protein